MAIHFVFTSISNYLIITQVFACFERSLFTQVQKYIMESVQKDNKGQGVQPEKAPRSIEASDGQ